MRIAVIVGSLMVSAFVLTPVATSVAQSGPKRVPPSSDRQQDQDLRTDAFSKKTSRREGQNAEKKEKAEADDKTKNAEGLFSIVPQQPAGSGSTSDTNRIKKSRK